MIELFFTACLTISPAACEERSLVALEEAHPSVMNCMMGAQPQLAQWSEAHPNMRVVRWSCRNVAERPIRA